MPATNVNIARIVAHLKVSKCLRSAGVLQKMITDVWGSIPKGFLNGLVLRVYLCLWPRPHYVKKNCCTQTF